SGKVARVEATSDSITEERVALVSLDTLPDGLSTGELAEVTLTLPATAGCRCSKASTPVTGWSSTAKRRSPPVAASRSSTSSRAARDDQPGRSRHPAFLGKVRPHRPWPRAADRRHADY